MSRVFRVVLLALALLAATSAGAADYWVKNGGSNAANGLSQATAWATLVHAANEVGPGDTVHVMNGNYQGFYLETSGTAAQPITFVAAGDSVAITSNNPTTPDGINLEGASHVVIDGFIVNNRTRAGVRAVLAEHVTVRNCRLGNNGMWGILTGFVDDFVAEGNQAHHSQVEHGIYVSNSADRPIVRNNVVWSNAGNGLHFNGDASLGGDGLIEDAIVEGNVIFDNGEEGGSGINMDGSVRGLIRNNLLYENHASGISLYRIDGGAGSTGNKVVNNTIVQASDGRWCVNIRDGSTGNLVRNNILYSYHPTRGAISIDSASRPGFVSDHNAVIGRFSTNGGASAITFAAWQGLGYDTVGSFVTTPPELFVAPGSDFHLLEDAPAVDAGSSSNAPDDDLDGNLRPAGAGFDIGAYELTSGGFCGDGEIDPGEECGEPGMDPCEGGAECVACQCPSAAVCESGITLGKPRLTLRGEAFQIRLKGEATIPEPWTGIDPIANGIRIVIDAVAGPGGVDITLPGGPSWSITSKGDRWVYRDPTGSAAGVTKALVRDRSAKQPGLLSFDLKGSDDGSVVLPDVAQVRTSVVLGAAGECASIEWNSPQELPPRCTLRGTRVVCK